MNRRTFVSLSIAAATHQVVAQSPAAIKLELPQSPTHRMPLDFTGLSYETGQLYNPDFFSPQNTALITAFRNLTTTGVLRLGGHLSNITPWEGVGQNDPRQIRGVRHGIEDYWEWPLVDPTVQHHKQGILTRRPLENLRGFLDAVNWRLLYGLNFASGSPARAADEAAAVSQIIGPRLTAFVIGNEPDGFGEDPVFRAKGYDFPQYIAEYDTWVKAIRARTPTAPFAGPDTENKVDTWVIPFARHTRGHATLLTSHFYGMGPASDPAMTAERLLQKINPELERQIASVHAATAAAGGTPYRMDEGNSCFGGGRPGVSDAYASALWVTDYMLHVASAGFVGVNLHGGGTGFYAPIESSEKNPATPRPMYYGMQFAQRFAGFSLAPCTLNTTANVTAYLGTSKEQSQLALINKGQTPIHVELPESLQTKKPTHRWLLHAPSLDAKQGVHLTQEATPATTLPTELPAYSAIILQTG